MENPCYKNSNSDSDYNKDDNPVCTIYPVNLGSPETTLTIDSESVSSECETEEWAIGGIKNNSIAPQTSTVNVEHSSDVVIGPLTHIHGPVTIYQNYRSDNQQTQDNLSVKCKSDVVYNASAKPTPEENSPEKLQPIPIKKRLVTSYKRLAIYLSIILTMLIVIIISIVVSLNTTSDDRNDGNENNNNGNISDEDNNGNSSLGKHMMFTKTEWGGRRPLNFTKLIHPTEFAVVLHTAGRTCSNFRDCATLLQAMQSDHVAQNLPDIKYNFLIGSDGNVYVGRGWDVTNHHMGKNIGISFIGNYVYDTLTPDMISALEELLDQGVKLDKLSPDYKLVCHNQTSATLSPGANVYKEISKLPHFRPGHFRIE